VVSAFDLSRRLVVTKTEIKAYKLSTESNVAHVSIDQVNKVGVIMAVLDLSLKYT